MEQVDKKIKNEKDKKIQKLILFTIVTTASIIVYTIYTTTNENRVFLEDILTEQSKLFIDGEKQKKSEIKLKDEIRKIERNQNFLVIIFIIGTIFLILSFLYLFKKLLDTNNKIRKNLYDISILKNEKEQLLQRYENAIDGTTDGLWDWNLKTNKVYFSKNWKKMLGYEDSELPNELEEWDKRVHPEDKEKALKDIQDNHQKITTLYNNVHRMKHKNGSWVWILDRGRTYFDKDNKPYRMVGFHSDISEMKNLEMNLKKVKNELSEFKLIIENAPLCILITDIDANLVYVNPRFCEISGFSVEESIGENPRFLRYEDDNNDEEKIKTMWETLKKKKTWGGIFKNKTKDNKEYWVTATILPITNSNGNVKNYLGIMREITKEVYLEKKLKEKEELMLVQSKNAAMGEMISMIAHQWRQPITTISMYANNIIADIELNEFKEEEIEKVAKNINAQTQYLSKTIDDFRNFFKADKTPIEFFVSDLIEEINSILLASIKNNNITYEVKYEDNIKLKNFKSELLQVMLNVIKNAKEALIDTMQSNKSISLTIKEDNENVSFIVSDNAGGIKGENLNKIFDAYFTTKKDFNGTGLGLYMSRIIVEKHLGGTINVKNSNSGAIFEISIKREL